MAGFGIGGDEPSGSATTVLVSKMDLGEMGCEDGRWRFYYHIPHPVIQFTKKSSQKISGNPSREEPSSYKIQGHCQMFFIFQQT
jgi:hypothetical protein